MTNKTIAMDKSMRSYDSNGHLLVEKTIITKAAVNPYLGKEIPDYQRLGLLPDKIYYLYRDKGELEKALFSFNGIQLLLKHTPVSADDPHNNITVGSVINPELIGNDVYASLRIFDKTAIALIEEEKLNELSSGYAYVADMTGGEFEGQKYDGVMRSIHGNHVAMVERGRIGRDAIIADGLPTELEILMKLKKGAISEIANAVKTILGMDSELPAEDLAKLAQVVMDNAIPDKQCEDEQSEADKKAEDEEDKCAEDEDTEAEDEENKAEDNEPEGNKPAMDADSIRAAAVKDVTALFEARDLVKPLVGEVAMDSAEAVYKYALQQKDININGVPPSAYKAMVEMLITTAPKPTVAMDSMLPPADKLTERFK